MGAPSNRLAIIVGFFIPMPYFLIHACIITPDSKFRHVHPGNGLRFTIYELIDIVHGHIRIIPLKGHYKGKVLIVAANAEGRELKLKANPIASKLAKASVLGDALVCERSLIQ